MTVIDALVVEFGLDDSEFTPAQARAVKKLQDLEKAGAKAEQGNKKLTASTKEVAKSTENVTRVLTSLLTVIGGTVAIKAMIQDFIDTNAQLDRLSKNLELNVSDISAWSNAAERLGGSAVGLQGTFDMLSKSQTQLMLTGESSLIPFFSALGVSLADAAGHARPVTDILLDLADRFSHMDRMTANNMGRMMGIDQGTMNLLLQGRKELELQIKRQKEHNAVTKEQAEAAAKLQQRLVDVKQGFEAFGRQLIMEAVPALEKVLTFFQELAAWMETHQTLIRTFLEVLAVGLGAIALAAAPIDLVIVAVLALAAAIALLWEDYQVWKKGGDALIPWEKWKPGIDAATAALSNLKDVIEGIFGDKSAATRWMNNLLAGLDAIGNKLAGILGIDSHEKRSPIDVLLGRNKPNDDGFQDTPTGRAARARGTSANVAPTGSTAAQAKFYAQQVSQQTGIPADIIFAQWQHETGNFTNRGARDLNNLAGINVPGGKGQDYRKFDSLGDFSNYYANLLRPNGLYPDASKARNADDFAKALKAGGYYSAPEDQYAAGMNRYLTQNRSGYAQALAGIPGAASVAASAPQGSGGGPSSLDKSVKTDIGTVIVNTQATDAKGIAEDVSHQAWDYLFASQANAGMN